MTPTLSRFKTKLLRRTFDVCTERTKSVPLSETMGSIESFKSIMATALERSTLSRQHCSLESRFLTKQIGYAWGKC